MTGKEGCPSNRGSLNFSHVFCYGRLMTNFNMPRPARLVLAKLNARQAVEWAASVEPRPPA